MSMPSNNQILALLDELDKGKTADDLENLWLEFKPWNGKESMKEAVEYAVCFANAQGGAIIFGVEDKKSGRSVAIQGVGRYSIDEWERTIYQSTHPSISVNIEELDVPEGTGKLLVVRVPKAGRAQTFCTTGGIYKKRIGKNCMPLFLDEWTKKQVSTGAIDWSGEIASSIKISDLDPIEIERARRILSRVNPDAELLKQKDTEFLVGLGAIRKGKVTNTGLLLFGTEQCLFTECPQHAVHYVHHSSETDIDRNEIYRLGLLSIIEKIEEIFSGPANPEYELSLGLFKLRIPAFPIEVVRESILNAVTHRDYSDTGEVLIRHTKKELVATSPGGFLGDITPENILRHEPITRNKFLAEAFQKLRLVERAGIGRLRIFKPMLSYGKRMPKYETDGLRVTLRIFNESFDERMSKLVAYWKQDGKEIELDGLLVLNYLRDNAFVNTSSASKILQLPTEATRRVLDQLAQPRIGILERRGVTKAATYHLTKSIAKDLLGKAAYTRTRGLDKLRYAEMVKQFLRDHKSITPKECRELLGLGESQSARVEISRCLRSWAGDNGFLRREGKGPSSRYFLRGGK